MSRVVVVAGFGGAADAGFLAPMLARHHEVTVVEAGESLETDADTVLVGYGVGAVIAAAHAVEHPPRALVLIAGWLAPNDRRAEWLDHAGDPAFSRQTMVAPGSDRVPLPPRSDALDRARAARVDGTPLVPTLVIGATYDTVAPITETRLLFGAIPGARWAEVPTGHAALVERPAEIVALVEQFVTATVTA